MENVEYVYTTGMSEAELEEHLREGEHGVLGLAADDDAYALPLSYHYDGERLLLRVSDHDDDATKRQFLETTDTATFVRYDATTETSWSILLRGPVEEWDGDVDETTLNEWFPPFRLFDEAIEDIEIILYELSLQTVVGRRSIE